MEGRKAEFARRWALSRWTSSICRDGTFRRRDGPSGPRSGSWGPALQRSGCPPPRPRLPSREKKHASFRKNGDRYRHCRLTLLWIRVRTRPQIILHVIPYLRIHCLWRSSFNHSTVVFCLQEECIMDLQRKRNSSLMSIARTQSGWRLSKLANHYVFGHITCEFCHDHYLVTST